MLDTQLERCLEGREKGENWETLKENLPSISILVCGERGRWLAHVKFCILKVKSTSDQYSLGRVKLEEKSRHVN